MNKFWRWLVTNKFGALFDDGNFILKDFDGHCYFDTNASVTNDDIKHLLIGYMIDYIKEHSKENKYDVGQQTALRLYMIDALFDDDPYTSFKNIIENL